MDCDIIDNNMIYSYSGYWIYSIIMLRMLVIIGIMQRRSRDVTLLGMCT